MDSLVLVLVLLVLYFPDPPRVSAPPLFVKMSVMLRRHHSIDR
jgi:hypothetical protein